jgi:hypothetical protein
MTCAWILPSTGTIAVPAGSADARRRVTTPVPALGIGLEDLSFCLRYRCGQGRAIVSQNSHFASAGPRLPALFALISR